MSLQHEIRDLLRLLQDSPTLILQGCPKELDYNTSPNDSLASAEIRAYLGRATPIRYIEDDLKHLPEACSTHNLILIGGPLVNLVVRRYHEQMGHYLSFEFLGRGVLFDRSSSTAVTPTYSSPSEETVNQVTSDYGVITLGANPFAPSPSPLKVMTLVGIKGTGTLAAAYALCDEKCVGEIDRRLRQLKSKSGGQNESEIPPIIEILIKAEAEAGQPKPETLSVESVRLAYGEKRWVDDSSSYCDARERAFKLVIRKNKAYPQQSEIVINEHPVRFNDYRTLLIYRLAQHRKQDYLNHAPKAGWVDALELDGELNVIEMLSEEARDKIVEDTVNKTCRRLLAFCREHRIITTEAELIEYVYPAEEDSEYDEFALELKAKRRIADCRYRINQRLQRIFGDNFLLIEAERGYRLATHPNLIQIEEGPTLALRQELHSLAAELQTLCRTLPAPEIVRRIESLLNSVGLSPSALKKFQIELRNWQTEHTKLVKEFDKIRKQLLELSRRTPPVVPDELGD